MKELLKFIVEIIAKIHDKIMSINDNHELGLNDKQLHMLVIGALGIGIFLAVHVVFKWLAKRSITAISWIYTFTLIIVIAFSVEIGQYATGTGTMSFADIAYGIWGFIIAFAGYLLFRTVMRLLRRNGRDEQRTENSQHKL